MTLNVNGSDGYMFYFKSVGVSGQWENCCFHFSTILMSYSTVLKHFVPAKKKKESLSCCFLLLHIYISFELSLHHRIMKNL